MGPAEGRLRWAVRPLLVACARDTCSAPLFHFCICVRARALSRDCLFATPRTVTRRLLSVGLSRQEHWSGLPSPSPGHLPDPGIEPSSPALRADSLPSEPPGKILFCIWIFSHSATFTEILLSLFNDFALTETMRIKEHSVWTCSARGKT